MRAEGLYILKHRKPIACRNLKKWGEWFEKAHRRVRLTFINDNLFISTVFLGCDHGYKNDNPVLFETMIFKDNEGLGMLRCTTWREALKQHWRVVNYYRDQNVLD